MSAEVAQTDESEDEYEEINLDEAIERSTPSLAEKFQKIGDALDEAPDHFSAVVTYQFTCVGTSEVRIRSSERWWNKGELGTDKFRILLGPRGGLEKAEWEDDFTGFKVDFAKKDSRIYYKWRRLLEQIRDAE